MDNDSIKMDISLTCHYYVNRDKELHRIDGPAITFSDGTERWYINGKNIDVNDNEQFLRLMKLKAFL